MKRVEYRFCSIKRGKSRCIINKNTGEIVKEWKFVSNRECFVILDNFIEDMKEVGIEAILPRMKINCKGSDIGLTNPVNVEGLKNF